jgi:predicted TIM-barrel fold metal-dependent hydrolase
MRHSVSSDDRLRPGGWSRRQWLAGAAGALAACESASEAPAPETKAEAVQPPDGPYIDGHVHVWTPDTDAYPISPKHEKSAMKPPSFTPEELFAHCGPAGVGRINLIQMSFYQDDHRYMLDAMARYPKTFAGTGLLTDITAEGAKPAERMAQLADQGLRAFRIGGRSGADGPGWMQHPNYEALYRLGAERNLILSFLINPADITEIDRLCTQFPDTPVIIDHLARIRAGSETMEADTTALLGLAKHEKVYVKVGAFYALSAEGPPYTDLLPLVERVVKGFGAERCMWESDCPYQVQPPHDYQSSIALIRDRAPFLSESDKEWILTKTAESLLF